MTVTAAVRTAMTSPTVPHHLQQQQQKASRVSNFSVASLLADTRPPAATIIKPNPAQRLNNNNTSSNNNLNLSNASAASATTIVDLLPTNLSQSSSSPVSHHDNSSTYTKNERHTPHSSTESEVDYDSNQEDSIVDIEDLRNENTSTPNELDKHTQQMLAAQSALSGHVPIRPMPFALASVFNQFGGGVPWPGARQMPFGAPGLFHGQGFPGPNGEFKFLHIFVFHVYLFL